MSIAPVKQDLAYRIHTTATTLTIVCAWWDMWWTFAEKESRKQHLETMNGYPNFFRYSAEANLRAVLVTTFSLYDPKSITLRSLLIETNPPKRMYRRIEKLLRAGEGIAKKIKPFRHKLIAHRSAHATVQDIYAEAQLTPNQIKRLITVSCASFNAIARSASAPVFFRTGFAKNEMEQLLQSLARHR